MANPAFSMRARHICHVPHPPAILANAHFNPTRSRQLNSPRQALTWGWVGGAIERSNHTSFPFVPNGYACYEPSDEAQQDADPGQRAP